MASLPPNLPSGFLEVDDGRALWQVPLAHPSTIGQGRSATIRLEGRGIPLVAGVIFGRDGRWLARSASTLCPLTLNDREIVEEALTAGDVIEIGRHRMTFRLRLPAPSDAMTSGVHEPESALDPSFHAASLQLVASLELACRRLEATAQEFDRCRRRLRMDQGSRSSVRASGDESVLRAVVAAQQQTIVELRRSLRDQALRWSHDRVSAHQVVRSLTEQVENLSAALVVAPPSPPVSRAA